MLSRETGRVMAGWQVHRGRPGPDLVEEVVGPQAGLPAGFVAVEGGHDPALGEPAADRVQQLHLGVSEVQVVDDADAGGEGGLLGIAVSPDYARDGLVYAYYTTATDNRISRFRLGERPVPIVTGIPVSGIHNGGRLAFGPDGMLYAGPATPASEVGPRIVPASGARCCA